MFSVTLVLLCFALNASADNNVHSFGVDSSGSRDIKSKINSLNVDNLSLKWELNLTASITAMPAIHGSKLYVNTWSGPSTPGRFHCIKTDGTIVWQKDFDSDFGFASNVHSRNTPAFASGKFVMGTMPRIDLFQPPGNGVHVIAVDLNGDLVWSTSVETHPYAVISQSPVIDDGKVFVGISSLESQAGIDPNYNFTFVGSMVALDLQSGQMLWKTYTLPPSLVSEGYSGAAIWAATPVVDDENVYAGTGQLYSAPQSVFDCIDNGGSNCVPAGVYFDAMMAFNKTDGSIVWGKPVLPIDAWNIACVNGFLNPNCPNIDPNNPSVPDTAVDYDYSTGSVIFNDGEYIAATQKNGVFWVRQTYDGELVCTALVGTTGPAGGPQGSMAMKMQDGREKIFVGDANSRSQDFHLQDGSVTTRGHWTSIDARSCEIEWETETPESRAASAITSTGGTDREVIFVSTFTGIYQALHARTGAVLWSFDSGSTNKSGPVIAHKCIYWGNGAGNWFNGPEVGGILRAFCVD